MVSARAMLALGLAPKLAASLLIARLTPTTVVGHAFWQAEGVARRMHQIQFAKNLGPVGGLLLALSEPGEHD